MATYEAQTRPQLGFGDVCSADWLHDVHLRADARALRREDMDVNAWWRKRLGLAEDLTRFPIWLAAVDPREEETYVLAHGRARDAVVISDDCIIESALGRDGRGPSGRLLLAPTVDATQDDYEQFAREPSMGRFWLPGDDQHGDSRFIELRRAFMVDARDIADGLPDLVVRSLVDGVRADLATRWAAYAARRGPLIVEDNAGKLARLLHHHIGGTPAAAVAAAKLIASPAVVGWRFEGKALERAGVAWDARAAVEAGRRTEDDAVDDLRDHAGTGAEMREDLVALRDATDAALAELDRLGI